MRTDEACRPPASSFCPPGKLALQLTNPLSPSIAAHRSPKPPPSLPYSLHTLLQRPLAHLLLLFPVVSGGVRTAAAAAAERTDGRQRRADGRPQARRERLCSRPPISGSAREAGAPVPAIRWANGRAQFPERGLPLAGGRRGRGGCGAPSLAPQRRNAEGRSRESPPDR